MTKMDKRQKGVLILTLVVLLFLGWQVTQLIQDDFSKQPPVANPMTTSPHYAAPVGAGQAAAAPQPLAPIPAVDANPNAGTPKAENQLPPELLKSLSFPSRPQYVQLANQYEMAKMQRQLLEEEVAIATARSQIAKAGGLSIPGASSSTGSAVPIDGALRLVFVSEQNAKWSATLMQDGQYQMVVVGTKLPPNIEVLAIDREGVLLKHDDLREKLSFNGLIILSKEAKTEQKASLKQAEQKITRLSESESVTS